LHGRNFTSLLLGSSLHSFLFVPCFVAVLYLVQISQCMSPGPE
jgi:hypothetical protein